MRLERIVILRRFAAREPAVFRIVHLPVRTTQPEAVSLLRFITQFHCVDLQDGSRTSQVPRAQRY